MKYHVMTNGKELAAIHETDPLFYSDEWETIGVAFSDYKRASEHAETLSKAWRQLKEAFKQNEETFNQDEQDEDDQQPSAWNKLLKGGLIFASGMSIALSVSALLDKDVEMALGGVQTGILLLLLAKINGGMDE